MWRYGRHHICVLGGFAGAGHLAKEATEVLCLERSLPKNTVQLLWSEPPRALGTAPQSMHPAGVWPCNRLPKNAPEGGCGSVGFWKWLLAAPTLSLPLPLLQLH